MLENVFTSKNDCDVMCSHSLSYTVSISIHWSPHLSNASCYQPIPFSSSSSAFSGGSPFMLLSIKFTGLCFHWLYLASFLIFLIFLILVEHCRSSSPLTPTLFLTQILVVLCVQLILSILHFTHILSACIHLCIHALSLKDKPNVTVESEMVQCHHYFGYEKHQSECGLTAVEMKRLRGDEM